MVIILQGNTFCYSVVLPELVELKGELGHYSFSPHSSLPLSHVPC